MTDDVKSEGMIAAPRRLDLFYLGSRDYVNGLTLFEESISAYMDSTGKRPEFIEKFQVNKWVRTDAVVEFWEKSALKGDPRVREASMRIDFRLGETSNTILLFPEPDSPVDRRFEEYDRKAYVGQVEQRENGETVGKFSNIHNMLELVRGFVEINHQYVIAEAAKSQIDKGISWAYLNRLPFLSDEAASETEGAEYGAAKIFDAYGNRYYIRDLRLEKTDAISEIGFFFPLKKEAAEAE